MTFFQALFIVAPVAILIGLAALKFRTDARLLEDGWRYDVVHVDGCTPKKVWFKP